jgi:hypothetical protein
LASCFSRLSRIERLCKRWWLARWTHSQYSLARETGAALADSAAFDRIPIGRLMWILSERSAWLSMCWGATSSEHLPSIDAVVRFDKVSTC